jgi:hypothetical protein
MIIPLRQFYLVSHKGQGNVRDIDVPMCIVYFQTPVCQEYGD